MPDTAQPQDTAALRRRVLATWDNEGGTVSAEPHHKLPEVSPLGDAEIIQLRIRVIALENLMIAVLAEGSDRQREVAREMAEYISPRPGMTHHPLTIRAADHMNDIVGRAEHFRTIEQE